MSINRIPDFQDNTILNAEVLVHNDAEIDLCDLDISINRITSHNNSNGDEITIGLCTYGERFEPPVTTITCHTCPQQGCGLTSRCK